MSEPLKKLSEKTIKKHPTVKPASYKNIHTTFYVKSKTPYISGIKHIDKMIKNIKKKNLQDFVTVVGMGKAVGKALAIIAYYKLNYKTEISTTTVTVLDTYTSFSNNQDIVNDDFSDSENETVNIKKRLISGVQIRIYI